MFSPADLRNGEELLLACNLLERRNEDFVVTADLVDLLTADDDEVVAVICVRSANVPDQAVLETEGFHQELADLVPDPERQARVVRGVAKLFDDSLLKEVGNIGEEIVVAHVRRELTELGRTDLAERVVRVSLFDDTVGYDISAPCIPTGSRLLEVKSTTSTADPVFVHLTRNESNIGAKEPGWSLVVCLVTDMVSRSGEVLGWVTASDLFRHLPIDSELGSWEVAKLSIHRSVLVPGIPVAVH
jgi:hypothetical protein